MLFTRYDRGWKREQKLLPEPWTGRVWVTSGAGSLNYGEGRLRGEDALAENKVTFHPNTFHF